MEEVRVTKIITSCFINATESTEKVTDALMNLFPEELKEKIKSIL